MVGGEVSVCAVGFNDDRRRPLLVFVLKNISARGRPAEAAHDALRPLDGGEDAACGDCCACSRGGRRRARVIKLLRFEVGLRMDSSWRDVDLLWVDGKDDFKDTRQLKLDTPTAVRGVSEEGWMRI